LDGLPPEAEIVVVDDRSDPPLPQSFALQDPRLRITVNGNPAGASGARNWGVAEARGSRILFLDDDDLLRPGYASWVISQSGDYGFSAVLSFSGVQPLAVTAFPGAVPRPVSGLRPFRRRLPGLGCGFWIDRAAFLKLGGIAEDIRVNEDTEFSVRLLSVGLQGSYSAEPGAMIRRHDLGHLTHATSFHDRAANFATILERHAAWLGLRPEARRHLRMRQVKLLAHAGDAATAAAAIRAEPGLGDRLCLWLHFGMTRAADRLRRP
jgi:glycosyltransferase involved in cell wall biosynthesis